MVGRGISSKTTISTRLNAMTISFERSRRLRAPLFDLSIEEVVAVIV
jgi:hypothetical protein